MKIRDLKKVINSCPEEVEVKALYADCDIESQTYSVVNAMYVGKIARGEDDCCVLLVQG